MFCLLELKNKKSSLRAAHGWISYVCKGNKASMTSTETVYKKIKQRPVYKDHMPKKSIVPEASVHVKIGSTNCSTLYDAYAIFIYNLAVLLGRRGDEVHKIRTKSICYERHRMLGGYKRPRVSFNLLNNKEDPEGEKRLNSMKGTRECVLECYTCTEDHNPDNPRCPISSFEKVWDVRSELYLQALGSSGKNVPEFNEWWAEVRLILRMKFDNSGTMVGFYSGGKTHRGMSLKNITKMYRHALILGGEDPKKVNKYTYHGGKRGGISFQKSFGRENE